MEQQEHLRELSGQPLGTRLLGYMKMTGPGYMQSAMTLGGGTIASGVLMGSLLGYKLLWVQPVAIVLGVAVLAAVAKQTTWTQEKPYDAFWNRLHPALALLWGISALVATVLWHIPQYSLTANGAVELLGGSGSRADAMSGRIVIGLAVLCAATFIVRLYHRGGARGLKLYEMMVKLLVWGIVFTFAIVAFSTGIRWKELFLGFTGISFYQDVMANGLNPNAIRPIVGGIAAAVGINMVFLYPYSLLKKNWGPEHKEVAYFDLVAGMLLPFLIATGFLIVAVANTFGVEGSGQLANDIRAIIPVVSETLGDTPALLLLGFGMFAVGFSTIITHMLACGFIGCELFGLDHRGRAGMWFSMLPAVGVVGVAIKFPFFAAVTASTLAALLMPAAVVGFILLLNMPSYMGEAMPRGLKRLGWNVVLCTSVVVMTSGGIMSLSKNWQDLKKWMDTPAQAAAAPSEEENAQASAPAARAMLEAEKDPELSVVLEDPSALFTFRHNAMGTYFEIRLYPPVPGMLEADVRPAVEAVWAEVDALEQKISNWIPDSPLSQVNRHAATRPVRVGSETVSLLDTSRVLWEETAGAFDPTVGPLLAAWGFYRKEGQLPSAEELERALEPVGMDKVVVDVIQSTVRFTRPGVQIDFGAIGKGYALDLAARILREHGIATALIHAGTSTALAMGAPSGKDSWTVLLNNPYNSGAAIQESFQIADEAFSTSSGAERYFEIAGNRYIHIFDPRTGRPVEGMLVSIAITPRATLADALSTAFFVMGREQVAQYCAKHEDVRAVLIAPGPSGAPEITRFNFT